MVSYLTFLLTNGLQFPRRKKVFNGFISFICSLLSYRLNVFLPQLSKVGCQKCLEIRNPWGKVMERSGLRFEHFAQKWSKIAAAKFVYRFFSFVCSLHVNVFLPRLLEVLFPNFLYFLNPWGKQRERSGLGF